MICTDLRHPLAHLRQPLAHLWNDLRQPFAHLWSDLGHGIDFLSFLTPQISQNHAKKSQNRLHNLSRKDFEIYISKNLETSLKIFPKTMPTRIQNQLYLGYPQGNPNNTIFIHKDCCKDKHTKCPICFI